LATPGTYKNEVGRVLRQSGCYLTFSPSCAGGPLGPDGAATRVPRRFATLEWGCRRKVLDLAGTEGFTDHEAAHWLEREIAIFKRSVLTGDKPRTERERMAEFFFGKKL
jgi:hypothetical protein